MWIALINLRQAAMRARTSLLKPGCTEGVAGGRLWCDPGRARVFRAVGAPG